MGIARPGLPRLTSSPNGNPFTWITAAGFRKPRALTENRWDLIIDGSENIAYRLALNTLRHVYQPIERAVHVILAPEWIQAGDRLP